MWDVPPLPSTSVKILAVPAHPSQVSPPLCNVDQCSPELNKCMWKNKQTNKRVCESPGDPGDMKTDSVGLTWGLKFYISDQLPDDTGAAGSRIYF